MKIEKAAISDAEEILELQKLCYQSEAELCNDFSIPPLTQSLEDLKTQFSVQCILKAVEQNSIIGSVRAYTKDDTCYIGRLIVHPNLQNKGIGRAIMNEIEACFGAVKRYELFTGAKSLKNLYFYKKLGYMPFRSEMLNETTELLYLGKKRITR